MTKKFGPYLRLCIARITGANEEVIALKNQQLTRTTLELQIQAKEANLVRINIALEDAEEKHRIALVNNGEPIEPTEDGAKNHLKNIVDTLAIQESLRVKIESETRQIELLKKDLGFVNSIDK